jgi:large conductance mechanosensitive channel
MWMIKKVLSWSGQPEEVGRPRRKGGAIVLQEFKDFINKGGVFEAAIGLIMALAFAPVVQSLVDAVIMPIIAGVVGQPNFDSVGQFSIGDSTVSPGVFVTQVISFVIIAWVVFLMVKAYNRATNAAEEEDAGPSETDLLTEIRDSLANR